MTQRTKDKLIETICKGEDLYIKDSGVKVAVDYFGTDSEFSFVKRANRKDDVCHIVFKDPPTKKALKLCNTYHIKRNSHTNLMELSGQIFISNLSLTPYESKTAKILYQKTKKT